VSSWILVPCLVTLRDEFNRIAPGRDKGADGSIGDSAHKSSSDHTPDEDSDVLRDHDADIKNEVHALDIDSTGPWPESFDTIIKRLVAREKAEYESATVVGRLKYVIWNRRIASRSWGWTWTDFTGPDPHTNHAHFSARYTTAQESDTRPWGLLEADEELPVDQTTFNKLLLTGLEDALKDPDIVQALRMSWAKMWLGNSGPNADARDEGAGRSHPGVRGRARSPTAGLTLWPPGLSRTAYGSESAHAASHCCSSPTPTSSTGGRCSAPQPRHPGLPASTGWPRSCHCSTGAACG
jgi:hypothetical protein